MKILEFLASEVSIYITIQKLVHVVHVLAFTDISYAPVWMHKASFGPVNEVINDTVAQWLVWKLVSN